jgi:hypothetical protein
LAELWQEEEAKKRVVGEARHNARIAVMRELAEEATVANVQEGAFGLSRGMIYPITEEEIEREDDEETLPMGMQPTERAAQRFRLLAGLSLPELPLEEFLEEPQPSPPAPAPVVPPVVAPAPVEFREIEERPGECEATSTVTAATVHASAPCAAPPLAEPSSARRRGRTSPAAAAATAAAVVATAAAACRGARVRKLGRFAPGAVISEKAQTVQARGDAQYPEQLGFVHGTVAGARRKEDSSKAKEWRLHHLMLLQKLAGRAGA